MAHSFYPHVLFVVHGNNEKCTFHHVALVSLQYSSLWDNALCLRIKKCVKWKFITPHAQHYLFSHYSCHGLLLICFAFDTANLHLPSCLQLAICHICFLLAFSAPDSTYPISLCSIHPSVFPPLFSNPVGGAFEELYVFLFSHVIISVLLA